MYLSNKNVTVQTSVYIFWISFSPNLDKYSKEYHNK